MIESYVLDFIVAGAIAVGIVFLALVGYVVVVALWGNLGDWKEWRKRNPPPTGSDI